jgi:hypothetical protein
MRIDLGNRAGSFDRWWIAGARRGVAWHYLKYDDVRLFSKAVLTDSHMSKLMITLLEGLGRWVGNLCGNHRGRFATSPRARVRWGRVNPVGD